MIYLFPDLLLHPDIESEHKCMIWKLINTDKTTIIPSLLCCNGDISLVLAGTRSYKTAAECASPTSFDI